MKKKSPHKEKIKKAIDLNLYDGQEVLLLDGFEEAFIGIGKQRDNVVAIYDRNKCIKILMRNMTYEKAEEYFFLNLETTYEGCGSPIFLWNEPSYE